MLESYQVISPVYQNSFNIAIGQDHSRRVSKSVRSTARSGVEAGFDAHDDEWPAGILDRSWWYFRGRGGAAPWRELVITNFSPENPEAYADSSVQGIAACSVSRPANRSLRGLSVPSRWNHRRCRC